MTLWKRAMDYLGLGPEDPYDDYDLPEEAEPPRQQRPGRAAQQAWEPEPRPRQRGWEEDTGGRNPAYRVNPARDLDPVPPRRPSPVDSGDPSGLTVRLPPRSQQPPARPQPVAATGEPHTVRPRRFDQAQEVADKFKEGQPVIMNLEGTDREISRRLIDFASGLCYGLSGTMEKVATGVYLLKPFSRSGYTDSYDD